MPDDRTTEWVVFGKDVVIVPSSIGDNMQTENTSATARMEEGRVTINVVIEAGAPKHERAAIKAFLRNWTKIINNEQT